MIVDSLEPEVPISPPSAPQKTFKDERRNQPTDHNFFEDYF